jgi:hypothetical protein
MIAVAADDGVVQLLTIPAAVRQAQAMVREHVSPGESLVDDLLKERRREVTEGR